MKYRRAAVCLSAVFGLALAQTAPHKIPDDLRFEVASLHPAQPNQPNSAIRPAPGGQRYLANNAPVTMMIMVAYRIKPEQVIGAPDWVNNDRWDMDAKAEKASDSDELHVMLKNMLVDRCGLKFHLETKEMPIYALSVDKGAPKMTPHAAESAGVPWIDQTLVKPPLQVRLHATAVDMPYFAFQLATRLDKPVTDMTNIKGDYDFDLTFTRELPPNVPADALVNGQPIDTSGPSLFEALKQQLGLKLESRKGPATVFVIDAIHMPTEN